MRRSAFTWLEMVAVLVILMIVAVILFPLFGRGDHRPIHSSCRSNLKQISLGIAQYIQDYDSKYPLVNSGPLSWSLKKGNAGWVDILQPYLKSTQIFQCAADNSGAINGNSDYFYNARLAGQEEKKLKFAANTIMIGDGIPDSPGNVSLSKLPSEWATDSNSPAWRHLKAASYAFTDGHVKWLKPTLVTNDKARSTVNTFAPW